MNPSFGMHCNGCGIKQVTEIESINIQDVVIRPATLSQTFADPSAISRIYNHYVDVGGATFDKMHRSADYITQLMKIGLPDGWYVADTNGEILGWASARHFSDRAGYLHACETAIYLDPRAIGKSIADPLQLQIEQHCQQNGFHHAMAKIIASNDRSITFHKRHGYTMVGIQKEIGYIDGQWVDVAIMQRLFDI